MSKNESKATPSSGQSGSSGSSEPANPSNPVAPPPANGAPAVPAGFEPLTKGNVVRLDKMTDSQTASASAVATEIKTSTSYSDDFGRDAPAATTVATALNAVAAWAREAKHAEAWAVYAKNQSELANHYAMQVMTKLKGEVEHALTNHPELADKYPMTVQFLSARSEMAQRGAATRKAKAKAKAGAQDKDKKSS